MEASERDELPKLPATYLKSDDLGNYSRMRGLSTRTRSASLLIPMNSLDSSEHEQNLVGFTGPLRTERRAPLIQMSGPLYANRKQEFVFQPSQGAVRQKTIEAKIERYPTSIDRTENNDWQMEDYKGKNEHLLKSGQLGMCNDPYCATCPLYYNVEGRQKPPRTSEIFDAKFHNMLHGDAKDWPKKMWSFLLSYIPGVMNPHTKVVQRWNKFFVISCLIAVFVDPFFFFLLSVHRNNKCIVLNRPMTIAFIISRSITDFIYLVHILLQFRLAYIAPESRVVGAGDLVDDPKMIFRHYFFGYFMIDFVVVLPLPQIAISMIVPGSICGAYQANILLGAAIVVQYMSRLYRFLPLAAGSSPIGFIFESTWANFVINLLTFVLASHGVGSCWYFLGLQRVNQCFHKACDDRNISSNCMEFIDCGHAQERFGNYPSSWDVWKNMNENAAACFKKDGFDYGIFQMAVNLTAHKHIETRFLYSLFWGFQQISTLAGNQTPSYFAPEILFTMAIVAIGLLLFALLIGNMQNFLQHLGRRTLEMSLRRRDVEQWMSHRRLPANLRP